MRLLLYKKDLIKIRMYAVVRTLQCGSLWCECEVTEKDYEVIKQHGFWYEPLPQ